MTIASDLFRTVTVKIHDISQQLPYIVVNQADDNGKIIRFVPMDHGQKVTGFTGARLYYPPRSDAEYGDYVTGVESDGAWDFTIPVGVLSVGRVRCNLAFINGDGETYSRNVVFLVEPAVSGVFDPEDGQQTRLDKIIDTVQDAADTAIDSINKTASDAVDRVDDAVEAAGQRLFLEVGTTTTGEPGSNAAVEIQKTGTKYTASFTIPRGKAGPAGVNENVPLGSTSGVVAQASDAYPALPRKVQVHGRTIENLWVTYNQATNNGVTLDTDDTGLITVTGNATTNTETTFYRTIEANPGDTFTVMASVDTDNTAGKLQIRCANKTGSYFNTDVSTTPKTFTIPEGNSGIALSIIVPYDASLPRVYDTSSVSCWFVAPRLRSRSLRQAYTP